MPTPVHNPEHSNRMHKVDIISRLKKSEPHNADHYQRQLEQQLVQHDNVIHRLVHITKMDDYFRRMEDLPLIDPLVAYEEVEQFPELFDAVSRISTEVNILERQMHQPCMYPILQSPVPTTSGFVSHRPTWKRSKMTWKKQHQNLNRYLQMYTSIMVIH